VNARSIRFRLVVWHAGVFLVLCVAFGAYTYLSLRHYLYAALRDNLRRRAHQIGTSLLLNVEKTGEHSFVDQLRSLYGPELNNRFIRISRPNGSVLYISGTPSDMSFEPARVPRVEASPGGTVTEVPGQHLLLLSVPFAIGNNAYVVDVGASALEGEDVLHRFLLILTLGLPVMLALAVGGGSLLIKHALAPVSRVIEAAHEITSHSLGRRLPVPRTGDEVELLSVTLNEMIQRLDEAFQHITRFTADASHELRTPLTVIRGELESVIQDDALNSKIRARLGTVLEEVERLAKIVEDLLAISRLEAGEALLERTRFDLANLVVTTAEQMFLLAEDKGIEISCVARECIEVEGDRARLKQVVVNLLDNAIKYTPAGGRISVETHRADHRAVLRVGDSGPGIPELAVPRVFERFFRVDSTRSGNSGGAGLGLAIARLICTAHGGAISVGNEAAGGCRVEVTLPLATRGEEHRLRQRAYS